MIHFFVPGIAQPAGSKRALPLGGKLGGRSIVVDANRKAKPWKDTVRAVAQEHRPELLLMEPLHVELDFVLPRPGYHYKKDGSIKPSAPYHHFEKPDALKLARAVEDALTGVIWQDDSLWRDGFFACVECGPEDWPEMAVGFGYLRFTREIVLPSGPEKEEK